MVRTRSLRSIEQALRACLERRREIQAAYIFGSVATGRMRRDSDLDVAVLLDDRVKPPAMLDYRLELLADLGSAASRSDLDVVILNAASPLLAHRVLSRGRLVFERSPSARVRFQVQTANRYMDLVPVLEVRLRYLKEGVREDAVSG